MSSQFSHCHTLDWLHVIPIFPPTLTGLSLCYPICLTATSTCGSVFFLLSDCCSRWCLCVIPDVPMTLVGVDSYHSTAAHCDGSMSSQVSHCFSLGSLNFVPGIPYQLTWPALCHLWCSTVIQWGRSMSFQVSNCHLLVWLCLVQGITHFLTWVALYHLRCSTDSHWGNSMSFYVSQCH